MITYDVKLCIGQDNPDKRLVVKCHDTGVNLRIFFLVRSRGTWRDEFDAYTIPADSTAVLKIIKPDKTYCVTDGEVESACATFALPPQAFTVQGKADAEVNIYGPTGKRITSGTFLLDIFPEAICEATEESGNYVSVMAKQIQGAKDAEQAAKEYAAQSEASAERARDIVNNAAWVDAEVNESGHLILSQSDNFNGAEFEINEDGHLEVTFA